MADLDIAEKRRPQDGRIRVRRNNRTLDIRMSSLPTDFGEKIVLRILDKEKLQLDINTIGFAAEELVIFIRNINVPNGIILVTGPTGSGKTTTLYAALNYLNCEGVNILTIEDPIEYNLDGISQSHVRANIGYTFAGALRTFLRQDPDIIMVGEIRDKETAEIAVRAALTGHLVFSTLHTNDAPATLSRLIDMGIEPYLITGSVRMVLAQRLIRKKCILCSKNEPEENNKGITGCDNCNFTGYSGRIPVFELMEVTDNIKELIHQKATVSQLRSQAIKDGMRTLADSAQKMYEKGITSQDEMLRVVG